MAFELITTGSKDWSDYAKRNNPLAAGYNVIKTKGMDFVGITGQPLDISLRADYTTGPAQIVFVETLLSNNDVEYYNIRISDGLGGEVEAELNVNNFAAPVTVSLADLNTGGNLKAFVTIGSTFVPQLRETPEIEFVVEFNAPGLVISTNAVAQGVLSATFDDLAAANGGTVALPAAAVGDVIQGAVVLSAATGNIKVSSIAASGDGAVVAPAGYTPFNIAKDASSPDSTFVFALDTATAGAKSMTITIISDATVSPYTFDVTLTVA